MYAMAGTQVVQQIVENPNTQRIGAKVLKVIESKLDESIKANNKEGK
jgi:hypothetical protein